MKSFLPTAAAVLAVTAISMLPMEAQHELTRKSSGKGPFEKSGPRSKCPKKHKRKDKRRRK